MALDADRKQKALSGNQGWQFWVWNLCLSKNYSLFGPQVKVSLELLTSSMTSTLRAHWPIVAVLVMYNFTPPENEGGRPILDQVVFTLGYFSNDEYETFRLLIQREDTNFKPRKNTHGDTIWLSPKYGIRFTLLNRWGYAQVYFTAIREGLQALERWCRAFAAASGRLLHDFLHLYAIEITYDFSIQDALLPISRGLVNRIGCRLFPVGGRNTFTRIYQETKEDEDSTLNLKTSKTRDAAINGGHTLYLWSCANNEKTLSSGTVHRNPRCNSYTKLYPKLLDQDSGWCVRCEVTLLRSKARKLSKFDYSNFCSLLDTSSPPFSHFWKFFDVHYDRFIQDLFQRNQGCFDRLWLERIEKTRSLAAADQIRIMREAARFAGDKALQRKVMRYTRKMSWDEVLNKGTPACVKRERKEPLVMKLKLGPTRSKEVRNIHV